MPYGKTALACIGNTPMISLDRYHRGPGRIFAKLEFLQPGGSIKDRVAKAAVEAARASGRLIDGQPVVEMTSGNMGSGLAVVCAVYNHPLVVTMSSGNSPRRAVMLEALGAEVVLVPQRDGVEGCVTGLDISEAAHRARAIAHERDGFFVDQFHNPNSVTAHEEGTGPEIWRQMKGAIDAFVCCVGSSGTFTGVAGRLRSYNADICCVAVEPVGCEPLAGKETRKARHIIQGVGYGYQPAHWRSDLCDATLAVGDDEVMECCRQLAKLEGLYVGFSGAANVLAARRLAERSNSDRYRVVTVVPDTGLKY